MDFVNKAVTKATIPNTADEPREKEPVSCTNPKQDIIGNNY